MEPPKLLHRPTIVLAAALVVACGAPASSTSPSMSPASSPSMPPASLPSPTVVGSPSALPAFRVDRAAPMLRARTGFDAVLLGDGSILAVGDDFACLPGPAQPGSETAERYDPATDTWTAAQSLNKPRKSFAMVGLADGRALVIGGTNPDDVLYSSTKLFDPGTGEWTDGPLLSVARGDPVAATLVDGSVLVGSVTSVGETTSTTTTEILDRDAAAWRAGPPIEGLSALSFTALTDGRVMAVADGFEIEGATLLFDPAAGTWQAIDGPSPFRHFRVVALDEGNALAISYDAFVLGRNATSQVKRFDSATGVWSDIASPVFPREGTMITRLPSGPLFFAGGASSDLSEPDGRALVSTELFDDPGVWTVSLDLLEPRKDGHAVTLDDGSVLIFGGDASFNVAGDVPWCPDPMTSTERVYLGS
jgi:Galactose oxidase, central domain